jgi:hypothetical protein
VAAPSNTPPAAGSSSTALLALDPDVVALRDKLVGKMPAGAVVGRLKRDFGERAEPVLQDLLSRFKEEYKDFIKAPGDVAEAPKPTRATLPVAPKVASRSKETSADDSRLRAPAGGLLAGIGGVKLRGKDQQRPIASEPVKPKIVPRSGQTQAEAEAEAAEAEAAAKSKAEMSGALLAGLARIRGAIQGTNPPTKEDDDDSDSEWERE